MSWVGNTQFEVILEGRIWKEEANVKLQLEEISVGNRWLQWSDIPPCAAAFKSFDQY